MERKNPLAVIEAFRRLLAKRRQASATLVIKISGAENFADNISSLSSAFADLHPHVIVLDQRMSDNEIKNLVRCSDCFVSLHRSEGFGRGLAEAMYLGKPVIGTAYSGNMDFMDADNSLPVNYELIPVAKDAYPFWQNQVWAEPDIEHALHHMLKLLEEPAHGYRIGKRASQRLRTGFSFRKVGLTYAERLRQIISTASLSSSAETALSPCAEITPA